ncbi:MAG TPA: hypothetical protein PLD20_18655 [Blastocatellia bacterium]|nr:hypothetical protein [Blastocatellia bacterium]HMV82999.1 hypothetical protein [Blastocatellia bacterium]HMX25783.1 hypothetical protein [Blastocatellia bacterium]HMZ19965.1 hypothetical protein [Blastocatellia bacterium]HNG32769.1 hypothetical protein [Blastocatellia bacterium]
MGKTKTKKRQAITKAAAEEPSQELAAQSEQMTPQPSAKPSIRDNVMALIGDKPVYLNSIASGLLGLDQGAVLREMMQARHRMIQFYKSKTGGGHTSEDAVKLVDGIDSGEDLDKHLQRVLSDSVDNLCWSELQKIYNKLPGFVGTVWRLIKDEARKEFESGHRMAAALETTEWQHSPWKRAEFLAIRDSFIAEWQPRGGIELAMIDTMAQAHSEYLYWCDITHHRATTEGKILYSTEEERLLGKARGHWIPPRVSEQAAIEHAMQMMDRYNRLFLRTLRQLRDLRRYSAPLTINNPAQVNIAADGGQQVNLAQGQSANNQ